MEKETIERVDKKKKNRVDTNCEKNSPGKISDLKE